MGKQPPNKPPGDEAPKPPRFDRLHETVVKARPGAPLAQRAAAELERVIGDGIALVEKYIDKRIGGEGAHQLDQTRLLFDYQGWYTEALGVMRTLVPDREQEFVAHYSQGKRKAIDVESYAISDYLRGLRVRLRHGAGNADIDAFDHDKAFLNRLLGQVALVKAARVRLNQLLTNLRSVAEAEVYRDELSAAEALAANRHLRAAGALAGVVLERHLRQLAVRQEAVFKVKKPNISQVNDALREAGVYDMPEWRRIQSLCDVRNLCAHAGEREPEQPEVEMLIAGVRELIGSK